MLPLTVANCRRWDQLVHHTATDAQELQAPAQAMVGHTTTFQGYNTNSHGQLDTSCTKSHYQTASKQQYFQPAKAVAQPNRLAPRQASGDNRNHPIVTNVRSVDVTSSVASDRTGASGLLLETCNMHTLGPARPPSLVVKQIDTLASPPS